MSPRSWPLLDGLRRWRDARQRRWNRRWIGSLRVVDDRLEHVRGGRTIFRIAAGQLRQVEFYKVDRITVDDVCCDLLTDDGQVLTIHEEQEGWAAAVAWLEQLPGFHPAWRRDVLETPFAENRTLAYVRRDRIY